MKPRDYIYLLVGVMILPVLVVGFLAYFGLMVWEELNDERRT